MIDLDHKGPNGRLRVIAQDDFLRIVKINKVGSTSVELHGLEIDMLYEALKYRFEGEKAQKKEV